MGEGEILAQLKRWAALKIERDELQRRLDRAKRDCEEKDCEVKKVEDYLRGRCSPSHPERLAVVAGHIVRVTATKVELITPES